MNKKVSVIIPAYNVEKYINKCLDSILEQTYKNIEIIAIDDGSHDDTWNIISGYMKMDPRIRGARQENKGVSSARNLALEMAHGYYIQFVDGDDYLPEDAIEKLVASIEDNGADWVNCQYHRIDEDGNSLDEYNFTKGYFDISEEKRKFEFIRDVMIEYLVGYEIWNKIYVADIIQGNGLKFDEKCHMGEDIEFNICYCFLARSIVCVDDRLYYYRARGGSAMQTITELSSYFDERLILLQGIKRHYEKCFLKENKGDYYQFFCKLAFYACKGHTAGEVADVASKSSHSKFCLEQLQEALKHKNEFKVFFPIELAPIYWRVVYYLLTRLNGSLKGKLYFVFYDLYRKLRGREVISEWKLV